MKRIPPLCVFPSGPRSNGTNGEGLEGSVPMCSRNDYGNGRKPVKPGCRNRKKKKKKETLQRDEIRFEIR